MRNYCWRYILVVILVTFELNAQNYTWWNETHQWDGNTHWTSYLNLAPSTMGPNAFPIPNAERMVRDNCIDLEYNYHDSPGEHSWDLYTRIKFVIGEKATLKFAINPIEYFELGDSVRDARAARDLEPQGYAVGDLLIEMNTLVYEANGSQLLLNIGLKTASGTQIRNARYTDVPAYYFNLSYHKQKDISPNLSIDIGALLGLYVWQTYQPNNRQNDAVLGALSMNLIYKKYTISNNLKGFRGYLHNGDQPITNSIRVTKNYKNYEFYMAQQWAINDYTFDISKIGMSIKF